ncbi:E3 ubiquitin/ISG15 ligase TRIM25-like [Mixophyes fleayi]|uniref:E3 ubiquitin/ISG15 ligase TRIM25-like n=1 Tax=Mixophyes fleayi TaxID=3061075 RepID=UPI003F4E1917
MASSDLGAELYCAVCLDTYTDPVSLRCGHNFCRVCIVSALDTQERDEVYSCPECRAEYQERPLLEKNRKLCNIVESFLSSQPEQKETKVFCTYCLESPVPAVKTCLQCETSMCQDHLSAHNKSVDHVLIDPTSSLDHRICQVHKQRLEYHCCEDDAYICVYCFAIGSHKGHQVESLDEAMNTKKKGLREQLEKLSSKAGETETSVRCLQDHKRKVQETAADVTERVTVLFKDLRKQLEDLETRVLGEISRQEEDISLDISDLIQELDTQRDDLTRKMRHIEELCDMTDPLTVLQCQESDFDDLGKVDVATTKGGDGKNYDEGLMTVKLHTALSEIFTGARKGFNTVEAADLSLDINTASNNVTVSGDLKSASWEQVHLSRQEVPERFTSYCQVLSTTVFCKGQHYWEVEVSRCSFWMVGMAYASMPRKGMESKVGRNKKSWCLNKVDRCLVSIHDSLSTLLCPQSPVCRIGVYLDYEAGRLSFYQLCDPIRHLHTFTSTFTEPLHAAFVVWKDGWIKIKS